MVAGDLIDNTSSEREILIYSSSFFIYILYIFPITEDMPPLHMGRANSWPTVPCFYMVTQYNKAQIHFVVVISLSL